MMYMLAAVALLGAIGNSSAVPTFEENKNWTVANQPPSAGDSVMMLTVSVNADGSLGWNGGAINDDQLRKFGGMVQHVSGVITTLLILRPQVSDERRDDLIRLIEGTKACTGDDKCVVVDNWTGEFPLRPPPPPPAPPPGWKPKRI